ncbi:Uncharacterised protein [Klebsiella quasipneumoniae]|nr:Uncharacterised protein [Klebsiella quasipneumoniae]
MRAHGVRKLDPHMPQSTDTDHSDLFAGARLPVTQR